MLSRKAVRTANPVQTTPSRGGGGVPRGDSCPSGEEVSRCIPASTPCIHHDTRERKNEHRGFRFYGQYLRWHSDRGVIPAERSVYEI